MVVEALLIAIWAGIAGIDMYNGLTHIHRPIVTGPIVGLILGDMTTGLMVGAALEVVFMGMVPLAGAQPPNVVIGGIIGTSVAILGKLDPQAAIGIAVPFAVAAQAGITLLFTAFSPVMHTADKYAEDANTNGISKINYAGMAVLFVSYFICAFLPIYFGSDKAADIVAMIPETVIGGLTVAGGIMPAIGFAMLLKIMLKKEYVAFLIVGFLAVTYFNIPILALALIGLCIALYDYYASSNHKEVVVAKEEYEDGI
ncbi:PTS N-acetylgalactosamine transporter subunit IIC [Clostridium sardiniense]|uniref:PTS N-acetylgalactosamine transporter subunit IIC n=1 Tax=Clostridium sardiniense TaxID=29369 RepID=UPI003D34B80E